MRKIKSLRFLTLVPVVMCWFNAFAQNDQPASYYKNVIPPSPNASSLGKYVDWPVNLYTGVPQIDVPIYELKGRSLSVPISLSYHASGIKVGENASCVGLGWALQAGGVITRSVRGLADDDQGPGYLTIRSFYNNPGDLSSGTKSTYNNTAFCDSMLQVSISNGNADAQPDLFMFNALGRSYKFYFAGDGTIVTQPYSNLKITFNNNAESWTVYMEDGTKLLFGGSVNFEEVTNTYQSATIIDPFISSWYLQSITSPTGEVINFTYYLSGSVMLDSYYSESDYQYNSTLVNNLSNSVPVTVKYPKTTVQTMNMQFITIATIESDLCKVYFDTTQRTDLPGSVAVSGIRIVSKLDNKTIKSFLLNYNYSTATSGNTYSGGYTTPPYRLKLSSLDEVPTDNGSHKIWQFSYNPLTLPSRKSYAQDWWGYYNGATGNTTMKPFILSLNPDSYPYGNHSADSASMMAEMLTKITYPTGGYGQFTYEPNSYPANEEQFTNVPVSQSLYLTYGQSNFSNTTTNTFTITKYQWFKYQFTGSFSAVYMQDYGPTTNLASVILKNSSGATVTQTAIQKDDNNITQNPGSILLSPGTYTFTMSSISPQGDFGSTQQWVSLNSSFSYQGSLGVKAVNHPVGAVRIKRIAYYDNLDNTKSIIKNYTYAGANVVAPIDTTVDFMSLTTDDTYDCNPPSITPCGVPCLATSVVFNERNTSTKFGLGSIQGGPVGYGKVTESFGPNGENGSNVYYYSWNTDGNYNGSKAFPYPPIISFDYQRGLLQEKDVFTAAGSLLSKTLNSYQYVTKNTITAYKVAFKDNILTSCYTFQGPLSNLLRRVFYQDQTNQVQKTATTDISYNTVTGDSLVTTTNFYYDDATNMQPVRSLTFNSKGDSVLIYNRTALEKTAINGSIALTATASAAIDTMVARNMVGPVLETEKYIKSVLINKALTNYKVQPSSLVLPDNIMIQNASNPIETRAQFTGYDTRGNLTEQLKANDVKHAYIYDYTRTYPVAELINSDTASAAYTSFESDGTGGWTFSGTPAADYTSPTGKKMYTLNGSNNITRSGLSSGTTYVISYWTKNSSAYTITGTISGYPVSGRSVSGWKYFEHRVTGITSVTITGSGTIDELRLYPVAAQMITYTYDPMVGLTSQSDINNRINYYEYDNQQRLALIRDQDKRIVKKICYNYAGQVENCSSYGNVQKSGNFTRNNCTGGASPTTVTYTVAANTYFSFTSQADADVKAQADVDQNGQAYANTNGQCLWWNVVKSGSYTRNNCATGGTGSTVTYTVAAHTYSSTISQADADQQAQNDVNTNGQNYANTNGTCTWWNVVKSGSFTRNNCATGATGSTVTYTVPANTYSSTTSQAAADQLAQNDVNANGQNYANTNGTCTWWNVVASQNFQKNNCTAPAVGTIVTYTVAAHTYSSTTSQVAADQQATTDINTNGQNYANANGSCVYWNVLKSGNFTRNNCGAGYVGSTVTYNVPAHTYSSPTSQAAADQLAINDVNANGQTYANTNGTCTLLISISSTNYPNVSTFTAKYTNTTTGQIYSFTVSASTGPVTMGSVPQGTYNITISKTGNTTKYGFYVGNLYTFATSASWSNVAVATGNHNTLIIDFD